MNQQEKQQTQEKNVQFDTKLYEIPEPQGKVQPYEPFSEVAEFDKKVDDLFECKNIKSQK
jgi:hypothetical protein